MKQNNRTDGDMMVQKWIQAEVYVSTYLLSV